MSKSIPEAHGKEAAVATPVEEVKEKVVKAKRPVRIVTLEDNTQANFGARANLLSTMELDTSTITFRIVTGKVINWVVEGMDNLTDFQKKVFMYGMLERVKSSLAPVKLAKLEDAIAKQIATISGGDFNIRSIGATGEVGLTDVQKAYALAFSEQYEDKVHWKDLDSTVTIQEVLTVWEGKSTAQRNAIRRHPSVSFHLNVMKIKEGKADSLDTL